MSLLRYFNHQSIKSDILPARQSKHSERKISSLLGWNMLFCGYMLISDFPKNPGYAKTPIFGLSTPPKPPYPKTHPPNNQNHNVFLQLKLKFCFLFSAFQSKLNHAIHIILMSYLSKTDFFWNIHKKHLHNSLTIVNIYPYYQ